MSTNQTAAERKDRSTCTRVVELLWKEITLVAGRVFQVTVQLQICRINSVTTP